ncbi:fibronectin type III domain-containing protein 9-like [Lepisosteus oculatus]|uniref:Fibronectin type III domain-containing protein 9-like n=1 Tax=Lepisosteus oculatus TaxID=7918 RepID=W5NNF0_LEPOC|nr:PREDICTED: fibronectin type III domain-containing protein 9-like [Lepisosteus oculatus]
MNLEIKNISFTSASVSWLPNPSTCPANLYRMMYRPNWNSILSGFSRKNFHREETVPVGRNSITLQRLTPATNYILCVTCQSSQPSGDQCAIFHTLAKDAVVVTNRNLDLATVVWLTSSILFIITTVVLLHGCFKLWCRRCRRSHYTSASTVHHEVASSQAWQGGYAETALVDEHCNIPTLSKVGKLTQDKLEYLPEKSPDGMTGLLGNSVKYKDKMAILPQAVYE